MGDIVSFIAVKKHDKCEDILNRMARNPISNRSCGSMRFEWIMVAIEVVR